MLIDQQNEGKADEWPNFMLYKITGLRNLQIHVHCIPSYLQTNT